MILHRPLSTAELKALQTVGVCANAIESNAQDLKRRLTDDEYQALTACAETLKKAYTAVINTVDDEDSRVMIQRRTSGLQLQFGYVRKHPDDVVVMSMDDCQTLIAPVLNQCDLDCPCIDYDEDGDTIVKTQMVRGCEIRKALKRIGLAEYGLSAECKYRHMVGK